MATKWRRQIECSRPAYRKSLLKASLLFGVLLLAEFVLVNQLVWGNFSRQHLIQTLASYRDDVQQVAHRLDEILKHEGKFDLFTIQEKLATYTLGINDRLAKRVAVQHIALYDVHGRMVFQLLRMKSGFI